MPGVTELAQRFERSSRSDSGETVGRTTPKPAPRVVVISKPGPGLFAYVRRNFRIKNSISQLLYRVCLLVRRIEGPSHRKTNVLAF